jgi:hypothetical protein
MLYVTIVVRSARVIHMEVSPIHQLVLVNDPRVVYHDARANKFFGKYSERFNITYEHMSTSQMIEIS